MISGKRREGEERWGQRRGGGVWGARRMTKKKEERDELKVWEEAVKARGVWRLIKFREKNVN